MGCAGNDYHGYPPPVPGIANMSSVTRILFISSFSAWDRLNEKAYPWDLEA